MIRIMLLWCSLFATAFAGMLEINIDGKPLSLPYWPAQKEQLGAVFIINGNQHNQASSLLNYLAPRFAENGWMVVLLQDDHPNALPALIKTLRQQNLLRLVVLHYGAQLQQTLTSLEQTQAPAVEGIVLLSAYDSSGSGKQKHGLNTPMFDIIGELDSSLTRQKQDLRQQQFATQKKKYLAIEIPGAQADYQYSQALLFAFIHGWMMKLPEYQPPAPTLMYTYLHPLSNIQTAGKPAHAQA